MASTNSRSADSVELDEEEYCFFGKIVESHLPGLKTLNFAYSNGGLNPTMFKALSPRAK